MSLPQRKSPRLPDYDYSSAGGYFVTICTHEKQHYFGKIQDSVMTLNTIGHTAHEHWLKTPQYFPSVQLSDYVVMPNHIHLILFLFELDDPKTTLGHVVGSYKAGVTRIVRQQNGFTSKLWQSSYHDHVIRNEADLNRIREYVQTNPARWEADTFYENL